MTGSFDISYLALALYGLMLIVPISIFLYLKIKKVKALIISVLRMSIQLAFVALYLEYIFKLKNLTVNIVWVLIMILIANGSVLNQSGLRIKKLFFYTFGAFLISIIFVFIPLFFVFGTKVLISPRYMIPLGGMILGNILRVNIISLERFYNGLTSRDEEFIFYIHLGATKWEAIKPFLQEAVSRAISPQIAMVATMGLVSLPGMMTGQILGGSSPAVAIKYQIMIMIAIFTTAVISTFLGIIFSTFATIDGFLRLKKDVFKDR